MSLQQKNESPDLSTPCTMKWSLPLLIAIISSAVLPISSGAIPTSMLVCTSLLSSSESFFWTCKRQKIGGDVSGPEISGAGQSRQSS